MRKKLFGLGAVVLLLVSLTMACNTGITFSGKKVGAVYGRIYNGYTRALLTSAASATLAGKITYYDADKGELVTADAAFSGDFYYFAKVPTMTPYTIEFSDGTTYRTWFNENTTGIKENAFNASNAGAAGGNTWFLGDDPATLGNVYLFPANINPGDVTIQIMDASNSSVIDSVGTVQLVPTAGSGYANADGTNLLSNGADARAPVVSGTLATGAVTVTGTSLVLGVAYTVEISGVAGYVGTTNAGTLTPMSADASTVSYNLTQIQQALAISGYGDIDSLGNQITTGTSLVITFNQAIELDPNAQYTAQLASILEQDRNGNGNSATIATFTGSVATKTASNHFSLSVSGSSLTITLGSSAINNDDVNDYLQVSPNWGTIAVRISGSSEAFTTLNTIVNGTHSKYIVRNPSALN